MVVNQAMKSVQLFVRRNGTNSGNRQRPLNKDKLGNSWMVSFVYLPIIFYRRTYDWTIVSGIEPTTGSSDASTSETSESEAPEEDDEDDEV